MFVGLSANWIAIISAILGAVLTAIITPVITQLLSKRKKLQVTADEFYKISIRFPVPDYLQSGRYIVPNWPMWLSLIAFNIVVWTSNFIPKK